MITRIFFKIKMLFFRILRFLKILPIFYFLLLIVLFTSSCKSGGTYINNFNKSNTIVYYPLYREDLAFHSFAIRYQIFIQKLVIIGVDLASYDISDDIIDISNDIIWNWEESNE